MKFCIEITRKNSSDFHEILYRYSSREFVEKRRFSWLSHSRALRGGVRNSVVVFPCFRRPNRKHFAAQDLLEMRQHSWTFREICRIECQTVLKAVNEISYLYLTFFRPSLIKYSRRGTHRIYFVVVRDVGKLFRRNAWTVVKHNLVLVRSSEIYGPISVEPTFRQLFTPVTSRF